MTQSAVEWLIEDLTRLGHNFKLYKKEIEQAKEMFEQQIINACESTGNTDFWVKYESYEDYYNETFKTK
jgi:hypothetical protein